MSKTLKKAKEESIHGYKNARKTKQPFTKPLNNRANNFNTSFAQAELRGFVPGHDMDDWL